jgi:hypothetical protein
VKEKMTLLEMSLGHSTGAGVPLAGDRYSTPSDDEMASQPGTLTIASTASA